MVTGDIWEGGKRELGGGDSWNWGKGGKGGNNGGKVQPRLIQD